MANTELPIFNRQQGAIQHSLATHEHLLAEEDALKKKISLEVSNAYLEYRLSQRNLKRKREKDPDYWQTFEAHQNALSQVEQALGLPLENLQKL